MSRLLIFDWDGTLCDSLLRIADCLRLAALDVGINPPGAEESREIVGLGLAEALQTLFPKADLPLIKKLSKSYSRHFVEKDQQPSPFFPHVEESLQQLRLNGHRLAVATGKSRRGLNRVFNARGLSDFFHGSRCADETASKPDPLMLQELLTEFGVSAADALMVGDTEFDMEMAVRAGIPRIAVSYGAHSADRLMKYEPVLCAATFAEVKDYILD